MACGRGNLLEKRGRHPSNPPETSVPKPSGAANRRLPLRPFYGTTALSISLHGPL
ncbi:MAG: hypothetical protein LBP64_07600 [Tannerella sp.]|nr:hypothetical protein [Tannerella sp.]